jgi:hypothetical protein
MKHNRKLRINCFQMLEWVFDILWSIIVSSLFSTVSFQCQRKNICYIRNTDVTTDSGWASRNLQLKQHE